ncbi:3-oxo-Delta(4,5)-steroid 5-beta-reductase [Andrographis paniculata]|uniref:3-oxo-Delta(4,5)-steroid 5-beta-reductase n=1 Tax=Andrographis paniculata TaxID=175694 RepID=UPI0021E711AC|nr:3-oxo-Delta(4,5)-steroid 5-beta-reductase [Andrographis paniculata]
MALHDTKKHNTKPNVAAIFGVTGLVGRQLARSLLSAGPGDIDVDDDWKVYGVARRRLPEEEDEFRGHPGYRFVLCDLLCREDVEKKLAPMDDVTHVFWLTWAAGFPVDTVECYDENKSMMGNALDVILRNATGLRHVSLQTGVKHYVSLTGGSGDEGVMLYDEESPRIDVGRNFYYGLEDLLDEKLPGRNVAWSIHRPGLIAGCSRRTFYNFVGSLCVYGTLCKYLGLPFLFGGTRRCWEEMHIDCSDARLVAEQHVWAATRGGPRRGEAFNAINGEDYAWKEIWGAIGEKLGVTGGGVSEEFVYAEAMAGKEDVWREIVEGNGLVKTEVEELANWQMLDVMFRIPKKMLVSRKKIDSMGFKTRRYGALDSMLYWIDVMRKHKYIP